MTAKAERNRCSKTSVSLTLAAVAVQATGTPSPSTAIWYLVPRLARSVGFGPVSSPPRLARTEQVSRIRSGWPRSMLPSRTWTLPSTAVWAQRAKQRRRVAPLAWAAVAVRLRHGVPSRRNRRSVATTRIVSVGGWPGPRPGGRSQASITVAMRCRSLKSNVAVPVWYPNLGSHSTGPKIRLNQPKVVVKTASKERTGAKTAIGERVTDVQRLWKEIYNLPPSFRTDGSQWDRLFADGDIFHIGDLE